MDISSKIANDVVERCGRKGITITPGAAIFMAKLEILEIAPHFKMQEAEISEEAVDDIVNVRSCSNGLNSVVHVSNNFIRTVLKNYLLKDRHCLKL